MAITILEVAQQMLEKVKTVLLVVALALAAILGAYSYHLAGKVGTLETEAITLKTTVKAQEATVKAQEAALAGFKAAQDRDAVQAQERGDAGTALAGTIQGLKTKRAQERAQKAAGAANTSGRMDDTSTVGNTAGGPAQGLAADCSLADLAGVAGRLQRAAEAGNAAVPAPFGVRTGSDSDADSPR